MTASQCRAEDATDETECARLDQERSHDVSVTSAYGLQYADLASSLPHSRHQSVGDAERGDGQCHHSDARKNDLDDMEIVTDGGDDALLRAARVANLRDRRPNGLDVRQLIGNHQLPARTGTSGRRCPRGPGRIPPNQSPAAPVVARPARLRVRPPAGRRPRSLPSSSETPRLRLRRPAGASAVSVPAKRVEQIMIRVPTTSAAFAFGRPEVVHVVLTDVDLIGGIDRGESSGQERHREAPELAEVDADKLGIDRPDRSIWFIAVAGVGHARTRLPARRRPPAVGEPGERRRFSWR